MKNKEDKSGKHPNIQTLLKTLVVLDDLIVKYKQKKNNYKYLKKKMFAQRLFVLYLKNICVVSQSL